MVHNYFATKGKITLHLILLYNFTFLFLVCSSQTIPIILKQPEDITSKPGMIIEFTIQTSSAAKTFNWYFESKSISSEETNCEGITTDILTIKKCLPKHKGAYKCLVTNKSGETFSSESATLTIGELANSYCNSYVFYLLHTRGFRIWSIL